MVRNRIRGVLLVLVGVFAYYQGWAIWHAHPGLKQSWLEWGLGTLALLLGAWQLTWKPKPIQN